MATPKKPAEADAASDEAKAAEEAQAEAATADEAPQPSGEFPVERLITEAPALLGVPGFVAAGAFHDAEEGSSMSLDAAKAHVEQWLNSPAHQEA